MPTIMRVGGGAGGGEKPESILPKGYTQLKYIQSTGTQYIDTGYSAPNGFIADVDAAFTTVSQSSIILGCHNLANPFGRSFLEQNQSAVWTLGTGNTYPSSSVKTAANVRYNLNFSTINGNSYLNVNGERVITSTDSSGRSSLPILVFAHQYNLNAGSPTSWAKLYSCKIYSSDNVLVRDYVPCKNPSGVVGLYDIVTKQFYRNAGTGVFVEGPMASDEPIVGGLETGDIIRITENGIPTEYYIAKHGYEPELNGANRTLLVRKDCHGYRRWHSSNVNAYETSDIDAWLNGDFYNSLSASVQEVIGATKFKYTPGNGNNTVSTLERAVFLLSLTEYGLANTYANAEGSKLPSADAIRLAKVDGTATTHWTRTPATNGKTNIYWVYMDGLSNNNGYATDEFGVRPAFTIPHDAKLAGQDNEGKWSLEVETASEVYGIARDITASSPEWTRTDAAMTFTAKASIGTVAGASDFDNIYPWSEMKRVTLDTGDVMVRIPKFYYGRTRNGNIERIQISGRADVGLTLHPAFNHGGVEQECIYVGAYKYGEGESSKSGVTPVTGYTRGGFRMSARTKGTGWGLIDISTLSAIQMLYLVEFANNNSQAMIGRGYVDGNSAALKTGTCDNVPNLTGRPAGTDGKTDIVYRGIEGIWGNVWEWIDGINYYSYDINVCNDPSKYEDNTNTGYTKLGTTGGSAWNGRYVTTMNLWDADPTVMIASAVGGSESTYYCDGFYADSGWRVYMHGGAWGDGGVVGLLTSRMDFNSSSGNAVIGTRLIYIP